ncbi:MAG TPA: 4-hydroxy-3-methylbut-2-enyl diphosphate reductase [Acidimicrobiales bacterium]|nr:4-hydroxy-3-methylbut-2-enyl diphosphate reductase [Acidimicrobiales bacterium]
MAELTAVSPRQIEAVAVGGRVFTVGTGPERVTAAGTELARNLAPGDPVALVGTVGGVSGHLWPGHLVVGTELRTTGDDAPRKLPGALLLAEELRRYGHFVHTGPIVSSRHPVHRCESSESAAPAAPLAAAAGDAIAVDTESAWLAGALGPRPLAVVLAVADSGGHAPVAGGLRALGALLRVRPALERWARVVRPRTVLLAGPRSFCAGVERAIDTVERALVRFGPPVYVRRQIVHNTHVVAGLEAKGAVFVEEFDQVPDGSTVVIAAHGVSPAVRRQAAARPDLNVIDATCPLVAKVHHEARRFADGDHHIVLIGHADHEEVVGTVGEAPDRIHLVEGPDDVARLDLPDAAPLAYLTQTTLATDETAEVVDALNTRFPAIVGPSATDICYATQNRQDAVRALAGSCDLMLVVGSANSSNTARLVEAARRRGCPTELIEDESDLRLPWLLDADTVGVTAGASAPESLVQRVIEVLEELGPVEVREHRITEETVQFALPKQVR